MDTNTIYDLFVIGGGINGCGIAADAAGRGLSVYLCEKDDLASHTSSASSKMIHGGLRYLEYYEFRLVREALAERDVLLNVAPHLIQPLRLVIPHNQLQRPAWMVRLGLWLYDHLGFHFGKTSKLPDSKPITLQADKLEGKPLKAELYRGFEYSDCKVDDARLVVLNAQAAQQHGASINTRTEFISGQRKDGLWQLRLRNAEGEFTRQAKALVNAAGPWVDKIVNQQLNVHTQHHIELVKGSHIVLPKLYQGEHAYLLQNTDKRVIFAIPYHNNFTMIGTTDIDYKGDPNHVVIDQAEREYLCSVINRYFKKQITPADIVNEWSGVRPLQADDANNPSAVTRDYRLEVENDQGHAPVLSIFGGKITTYRRLAEHAMNKLKCYFPHIGQAWTATTPLPGGNLPNADLATYIQELAQKHPTLPLSLVSRWAMAYGTNTNIFAKDGLTIGDLGELFLSDLYQIEVDYLVQHEWAHSAEDILWRRTKLGLYAQASEVEILKRYLEPNQA